MIRLNDILDKVAAYNPSADLNLIRKAYVYCAKVHQGQTRLSGEPYIIHPMEVAGLLADLKLDVPSSRHRSSARYHRRYPGDLRRAGRDVRRRGGRRWWTASPRSARSTSRPRKRARPKTSARCSWPWPTISASSWSSWPTGSTTCAPWSIQPEAKQRSIAKETLDIYAPIANRLGISWIKASWKISRSAISIPRSTYDLASQDVTKKKQEREAVRR